MRCHPKLARGVTHCAHCGIRFLTHPCNTNRRDLRCPFGCRRRHHRELGNRRSAKYSKTSKGREQKKLRNQRRSCRTTASDGIAQLDARSLHDHSALGGDGVVNVCWHPQSSSPCESPGLAPVSGQVAKEGSLELSPEEAFRDQPLAPERHVVAATDTRVVASCMISREVPARPGHLARESRCTAAAVQDLQERPLTLPLEGLSLDEASVVQSPMLAYVRMVASLIERRGVGRKELVEGLRRAMRQRSLAHRSRTHYVLHFLHQHPP